MRYLWGWRRQFEEETCINEKNYSILENCKKIKEMESVFHPIMTKLYQSMGNNMDNNTDSSNTSYTNGPTVDEVD